MAHVTTTIILAEHAALGALLRAMLALLRRHREQGTLPDFALLRMMLFYIDEFPEQRHHHKESGILFPRLCSRTPLSRAVLDRLEEDHAYGTSRIRDLEHALMAFELLGDSRRGAFEMEAKSFMEFYFAHMATEEREILPLAERVLRVEDWAVLDGAFAANRDPLAGEAADPPYRAVQARLKQVVSGTVVLSVSVADAGAGSRPPAQAPAPARSARIMRGANYMLRAEHASLRALLRCIRGQAARIAQDESDGALQTRGIGALRATFFVADEYRERRYRRHDAELLFPLLRARTSEGHALLAQLEDHQVCARRCIREVNHTLLAFEIMGASRRKAFEQAAARYVDFCLAHIDLEERELQALTNRTLRRSDWRILDAAWGYGSDPLEACLPEPEYASLRGRVRAAVSAAAGLASVSSQRITGLETASGLQTDPCQGPSCDADVN
jgi:hemerythrin-like domain-containing protein